MANGDRPLRFFVLAGSEALGEAMARHLAIEPSPHEVREFEDGEHKIRPLTGVEGADCYVVSSLAGDARLDPDKKLVRMLFFIGALKDAGAARVTAVTPYLAYGRKDRRTKRRDPLNTRYTACLFEAVGTDAIVTMDVHNPAAFENAFRIRTVNLDLAPLLVDYARAHLADLPLAIVSPDAGGVKRAERVRKALAAVLEHPVGRGFVEKYRSGDEVSGETFVGDVAGREALIVDDMIASGTTLVRAAAACRKAGATAVHAAATHGLFQGKAEDILGRAGLDTLIVSDTLPPWRLSASGGLRESLVVLPASRRLAEAVDRLHRGRDLSAIDDTAPPDGSDA